MVTIIPSQTLVTCSVKIPHFFPEDPEDQEFQK